MANTGSVFTSAGTILTLETLASANVALFNDGTNNTMRVLSIQFSDISSEVIEKTGIESTGAREFMRSLIYDPGMLQISARMDLDKLAVAAIANAMFIDGDNYNMAIQFPVEQGSGDSTGPSLAGDGFISNVSFGGELGGAIDIDFSWKWSGAFTIAPSS